MLAALAFFTLAVAQAPGPASAGTFDRVVLVDITESDPVLEGRGPAEWVEYAVEFSGTLHVWTNVEGNLDTFLQVVRADTGLLVAKDEDSGGRPTPYLKLDVKPGLPLAIAVAASKTGGAGKVELHLVASVETDSIREDVDRVRSELSEIQQLRGAQDHATARERAQNLIEGLASVVDGGPAESSIAVLREAAREMEALGLSREAVRAWTSVVDLRARTQPVGTRELQRARGDLAWQKTMSGDPHGGREIFERVLDVAVRTLPASDNDLIVVRMNLSSTLLSLGDPAGAEEILEEVLSSRALPWDHSMMLVARQNLANVKQRRGDLTAARSLLDGVLEATSDKPLDPRRPQTLRMTLATTLRQLGDLRRARSLLEQSIEEYSRTLPDDHTYLLHAREGLANVLIGLGDFEGARDLYARVLETFAATLPADNLDLLRTRGNLATALYLLDDMHGARALLEEVLAVRSRTLPDSHRELQRARQNLAAVLYRLDDLEGARSLGEQALAAYARTLPDDHKDVQTARSNLTLVLAAEVARLASAREREAASGERREQFCELALAYARALQRWNRTAIATSSGREAEEQVLLYSDALGHVGRVLSLVEGYGIFPGACLPESLAFLTSETARNAALASARVARRAKGDPDYTALRARVHEASTELARLAQSGASSEAIAEARTRVDRAERDIVELAARLQGSATSHPDLPALVARVGPKDALVAYRRYPLSSMELGSRPRASETESLCAFVVRPGPSKEDGAQLARVELGPIEPIEAAVERWRQALGVVEAPSRGVRIDPRPESDPHARGVDLRRLIFDPLLTQLAGVERIVVALDDVLHLVPLDALPANGVDDLGHGPAEPLLGDLLHVELRLGLFELLQEDEPVQGGGSLVVFGDVDYGREGDGPSDDPSGPASRAVERAGILRGSVWEAGFGRLSGTGVEARGIESILRGSAANATAIELRTGAAASRANLLELAPKARYLHVATHGWFAPDSIRSHDDPAPRDERLDLAPRTDGAERARGMSPMLLCGLALSGANLPEGPTGRVPGLVTAEELATLDLAGCELAVLSACDTNVGQRRAGQGVASLQRAMHMAGARSVITSLWKVPDEATTELMLEFYRRLWVEKQSKAEALWEAKSTIRRARDAHGVPRYTTRDWAAWVLTGEPR